MSGVSWPTVVVLLLSLFTGARGNCLPSNVRVRNYVQFPMRSVVHNFEAVAVTCREFDRLFFSWEVVTEKEEMIPQLSKDGALLRLDGYRVPARSIPMFATTFAARIRVSHFSDFSEFVEDVVYFRFRPDSMSVKIKGGYRRTFPIGQILVLDGLTESEDPSYAPGEDAFAGNPISWWSYPPVRRPPRTFTWTIPTAGMRPGATYTFTLTVNRTKIPGYEEQTRAVQKVTFLKGVPALQVDCVLNCLLPHSEQTTLLSVSCPGGCPSQNFSWYSNVRISRKSTEFGDGYSQMLVRPGTLKPGQKVLFGVTLRGGDASVVLTYMAPIHAGACAVRPRTGVSGYTKFGVVCNGFFSSHGDLSYFVYQGDVATEENAVLVAYGSSAIISDLTLSEGKSEISVAVVDARNMVVLVRAGTVSVEPFRKGVPQGFDPVVVAKTIILGKSPRSLRTLLADNDRHKLVQVVAAMVTALPTLDLPVAIRRDLMKHIAEALAEVDLEDYTIAKQMTSVVGKMLEKKDDRDTRVTCILSNILASSAEVLHAHAKDPRERWVTLTEVLKFGKRLLDLFSELFTRNKQLLPFMQTELPAHDYDSYDEMISEKIVVRLHFAECTKNLLRTLVTVTRSILRKAVLDQKAIQVASKGMLLSVRKLRPSRLVENRITFRSEDFEMYVQLSPEVIRELTDRYGIIEYGFSRFTMDPFWWHMDHRLFVTEYLEFHMFGDGKKIEQLDSPVDVYVKILHGKDPTENVVSGALAPGELAVYRVSIRKKTMLKIILQEEQGLRTLLQPCPPTREDLLRNGKVRRELTFLPKEDTPEEMFFGIYNENPTAVSYNGTVSSFICITWDDAESSFVLGGFITSEVKDGVLHCSTRHLSLFGGQFGVPPNQIEVPIEMSVVLFLHTNFLMIIVVSSVFLLWLILMIWAVIRDRKIARMNTVFLLADSMPGDEFGYLVVVVTGNQMDAGTTANVGIQLVGTEAESRPHLIQCEAYEPLQAGSEDWFILYCPKPLGTLVAVRLWHDCRGRRPHWFCSRVVVQEMVTGNQYCFLVDRWLSLVWGDGEVSREVVVATEEELASRPLLFTITFVRGLRDNLLWLSIFSSAPQSNFSTKERVSVSIALLLLSMLVSGMFYGVPRGDSSDAIFVQGSFYITTSELIILVESLCVSIPATTILLMLFKRSGPPPLYV